MQRVWLAVPNRVLDWATNVVPEDPDIPLFTVPDRTAVLRIAADYATGYLEEVNRRSVSPAPKAVAELDALTLALPEESTAPQDVVRLLGDVAGPATVASNGGRYFGFVTGGCLPAAMGAAWLVSAWDQNTAFRVQSPAGVALEATALDWVRDLLGLACGLWRSRGDGGDHGQLHCPGGGAACPAGARWMGCGARRVV